MSVCAWCGRRYVNGDIGWVSGDSGRSFCCEGHRYEYINARYGEEIAAERAKKEREEMLKGLEEQRKKDRTRWYGSEWVNHLIKCPEDAFQCDWSKLTGADCAKLFSERPKLAPTDVDWAKRFNSDDWVCLLSKQPQFADKCDWSKLDNSDCVNLFSKRPEVASACVDWTKRFSSDDWVCLLSKQPQFADKCDWSKLDGEDWVKLLISHPEFIERCKDLSKLSIENLKSLLRKQPRLIDKFINSLDVANWVQLLLAVPSLAKECNKWNEFSSTQLLQLLQEHPEFSEYCIWTNMTEEDFVCLLSRDQEGKIKGHYILDWGHISGRSWAKILIKNPSYVKRCEVGRLNEDEISAIVRKHGDLGVFKGYAAKKMLAAWAYFLMLRWQKAITVARSVQKAKLISNIVDVLSGIVFRLGVFIGFTYGLGEYFHISGKPVPDWERLMIPGILCVGMEGALFICQSKEPEPSLVINIHDLYADPADHVAFKCDSKKRFNIMLVLFSFLMLFVLKRLLSLHSFTELGAVMLRIISMWFITRFLLHTEKDAIIKFKGSTIVYLVVGLGIGWLGSPFVYASTFNSFVGLFLCCALTFIVGRLFYLDGAWQWRKFWKWDSWDEYEARWRLTLKYGLCIGALCCVRIFLMKGDLSVFW